MLPTRAFNPNLILRNGKGRKGGLLDVRHEKERASFSAGRTLESALSSTGSIRARYLKLPKALTQMRKVKVPS